MIASTEFQSRILLGRLRDMMAQESAGQARLDQIVKFIADGMGVEVCSIYLFSDSETLELCATKGLRAEAVHKTRMKLGEGLVGRVAQSTKIINTANAPNTYGFRYMPETGEDVYSSFLGVPVQHLGRPLGVLVLQSKKARKFIEDEIYALEIVAMVLAEMTELGAFFDQNQPLGGSHMRQELYKGVIAQEGIAEGNVWLHEPRVVVTNPISEDPQKEESRLQTAVDQLLASVDQMMEEALATGSESREVLEAYRMFAHSKGWMRRIVADIGSGLSAEAAVERQQSQARMRLARVTDAYLRNRLHDIDDFSNRLLRILTGQGRGTGAIMPDRPVLVASSIGPAELLEYGKKLKAIVLEEGAVGSHAAIIARAYAIPLIINTMGITTDALNGDLIIVDGGRGNVHLRPDEAVASSLRDKIAMQAAAQDKYREIRDLPAETACGKRVGMYMNAGLIADLPSLVSSGAEGVGLFRTELQFLARNRMPRRSELAELYASVMDAAQGKKVMFRTLDIGSDKVLPYMKPQSEPNPAMGWRAIRIGLDKRGVLRMQIQALIRGARGRSLSIMVPFVTQMSEFEQVSEEVNKTLSRERKLGHQVPERIEIGAMLETPSLAFAPDAFFEKVDFISIGGNDLKQFFFAADRQNELVRRRYDMLNVSYLTFLEHIVARCRAFETPLSFCGEDAGRPMSAACLAAIGIRNLSMRSPSIGPVKHLLRQVDLDALKEVIDGARSEGKQSAEHVVSRWLDAYL